MNIVTVFTNINLLIQNNCYFIVVLFAFTSLTATCFCRIDFTGFQKRLVIKINELKTTRLISVLGENPVSFIAN